MKAYLLLAIALLFVSCAPVSDTENPPANTNTGDENNDPGTGGETDTTPVGTYSYDGDNASNFYISGKIVNGSGEALPNITIEFSVFDNVEYSNIVEGIKLRSSSTGEYSIINLPDLAALNNVPPECISFSAYDENDFYKYEGINFHPYVKLNTTNYTSQSNMNILMLEVNNDTVLTGIISFQDGTHPAASQLVIDMSYGNGSNQNMCLELPQMSASGYTDERTGSYYNEATGEYRIMKFLCGGDFGYQLHVNYSTDSSAYASWNENVVVNPGVENQKDVVLEILNI